MKRHHFNKGDPVPAFMLDVEPVTPGGPRPRIVFTTETEVFETDKRFVAMAVVPSDDSLVLLDAKGAPSGDVRLLAFVTTKPFIIVDKWTEIRSDDDDDGDAELPRLPTLVA